MRKRRHANVWRRSPPRPRHRDHAANQVNRHGDSRHFASGTLRSEPERSRPVSPTKRFIRPNRDLNTLENPRHSAGPAMLEPEPSRPDGWPKRKGGEEDRRRDDEDRDNTQMRKLSRRNDTFSHNARDKGAGSRNPLQHNQKLSIHVPGSLRSGPDLPRTGEPEQSRTVGLGKRKEYEDMRYDEDKDRDLYLRKLSQYNETLSRGVPTSMKFQWDTLLSEKPVIPNLRSNGYGVNDTKKMCAENEGATRTYSIYPTEGQEKPMCNLRDTSPLKDYLYGIPFSSEGIRRSKEIVTEPAGNYDGYAQRMGFESSGIPELPPKELAFRSLNENMGRNYRSPETQRRLRNEVGAMPTEFPYRKMESAQWRPSIVDSIVEKIDGVHSSVGRGIRESRVLDHHGSLQEQQYLDVIGASGLLQQDEDVLRSRLTLIDSREEAYLDHERLQLGGDYGSKVTHLDDRNELFLDNGSLRLGEYNGFERDGGLGLSHSLSENDEDAYEARDSSHQQQMFKAVELTIQDQPEKMIQKSRIIDLRKITQDKKNDLSHDWDGSNEDHKLSYEDQQRTDDDIENSDLRESVDGQIVDSDNQLSSLDFPISMRGRLVKPIKPYRRDIKKLLRPGRKVPKKIPWVRNSIIWNKSLGVSFENHDEGLHAQGGNSSKVKAKRKKGERPEDSEELKQQVHYAQGGNYSKIKAKFKKSEPPEDSEDFKQQVHNAFLKFVKVLNESTAQRRKYMEQGGKGTLKCCVCGSNSKEFVKTQSLASHAFSSYMLGIRAEHLGLHRALCVLMGWNYRVAPNSPWVPKMLFNAEAMALKEDLIIWPPVVFVHNSSIANHNPNERIIVSIEELGAILRGMGFDPGMAKVCRGRPANQSIMVVTFQATFSGLQEAERLQKLYAETKHGRVEFQQLNFSCANRESQEESPADKVNNVLYGYLGIAGDLDKLDFGTKRRSVAKSKNDIKAIANAPLDTK